MNLVTDLKEGNTYQYFGDNCYNGKNVRYLGIQDFGYQKFHLIEIIDVGKVIPVPLDAKFCGVKGDNFSTLYSILNDE